MVTRPKKLLGIAGLLVIAALGGCHGEAHETHAEHGGHAHRLEATRPLRQDVNVLRDYVGQIRSSRHIELRALERGYLEEVAVHEGQWVEAGQPMFRILPRVYEAELRRAEAEAEAARLEYENTRRLAEGAVVSETELALSAARYEQARAEVSLAEAHLNFTRIDAPFAGIMDRLLVREGSLLDEGELLTTLSDNSSVWVYFNVPEAEYLDYAASAAGVVGRAVRLRMANGADFPEEGRIAAVEADFDNTTGTIAFRADFPNPAGLLRHGQTGNVLVPSPLPSALLVPQKATFEVLDHVYVFVIDEGGRVVQRRIHVAEEFEDLFVVDDGLDEQETVLLEGLRQVRAGQEIEYAFLEPETVFSGLKVPAE
ncbi:MAG: efflux RND transporter periplasmic adaptor subunit [Pseudomonadales bacterium]|nr:efflux RND transporter periplasmic adaptor subunit [Pseudomonadales bacterium]